jgi:hypothetical protein
MRPCRNRIAGPPSTSGAPAEVATRAGTSTGVLLTAAIRQIPYRASPDYRD